MDEIEMEVELRMMTLWRWFRGVRADENTRAVVDAGEHVKGWSVRVSLRFGRGR